MFEHNLNTTPLFQTSLRLWQARYKESHSQGEHATEETAQAAAVDALRNRRLGRLRRRPQHAQA